MLNLRDEPTGGKPGRAGSAHSVADTSPLAPADDPAVAAFAELVAARGRRDVKRTVAAQRRLRDVHGYLVSLVRPGGRASR